MLSAVNPCRFRLTNGRKQGTVPVGTIIYVQSGLRPMHGFSNPLQYTDPSIVIGFQPMPSTFDGMTRTTYGSEAIVQSLRTGKTRLMQEWQLLAHDDAFLTKDNA